MVRIKPLGVILFLGIFLYRDRAPARMTVLPERHFPPHPVCFSYTRIAI